MRDFACRETPPAVYRLPVRGGSRLPERGDFGLLPVPHWQTSTRRLRASVPRDGRAPVRSYSPREVGELEAIAGVEHRKGRAFYGLRRQATDLAPEFAQDAQVLNRISDHSDSATRERIYQDAQNERVRARAAEARRNMRAFLTEADQKKAA